MTGAATGPRPLAAHLVPLPGGEWTVWRTVAVRAAGFPASGVLDLATTASADGVDAFNTARASARAAREAAARAVRAALSAPAGNGPDDRAHRRGLLRAATRIRKGQRPVGLADPAVEALVDPWQELEGAADRARRRAAEAFESDLLALSARIAKAGADPRFQEALIWQNRDAHTNMVRKMDSARAGTDRRNKYRRRRERLVGRYLQRYCTKNDSIGFFGPIGWGALRTDGAALAVRPGPDLLAARGVFFESWGLDAIAQSIVDDYDIVRWVPPRRRPAVHIDGNRLDVDGEPTELFPARAALLTRILALCDGTRSVDAIAAAAGMTDDTLLRLLASMRVSGLIVWDLDLPLQPHPERRLCALVERIGDPRARAAALGRLQRFVAARDRVAAAAGHATELAQAMAALEETFTELTGRDATRSHGALYAGRTLLYEDCRRNVEVDLGPQLLAELGPPLTLMLTAARWLTHVVAEAVRHEAVRIHEVLSRQEPDGTVRFLPFWRAMQPVVLAARSTVLERAVEELRRRWHAILRPDAGQSRIHHRSADLAEAVRQSFAAPGPGWNMARYQCPDIMLEAPNVEAVLRGDYRFVLGELHVGTNTVQNRLFLDQHPDPDQLLAAYRADIPEPVVHPVLPKELLYVNRLANALRTDKDYRLLLGDDASWLMSEDRVLVGGALTVVRQGDQILVRSAAGGPRLDIVDVLADALSFAVASRFSVVAPSVHSPRITIDRMVVARETWRFSRRDLAFATVEDEFEQFVQARAWADTHGIPRFVFARVAHEPKPFYVDFASPVFVSELAHAVRGMPGVDVDTELSVAVSEMLPTAEHSWLTDHEGQRYTSELRVVAVDTCAPTITAERAEPCP